MKQKFIGLLIFFIFFNLSLLPTLADDVYSTKMNNPNSNMMYSSHLSEFNILFLHGMPETPNVLVPLKEKLKILFAEKNITMNSWYPHLPDAESVDVWAENIADEINQWSPTGQIVIIGLSMGGKAAVHAVADDSYGIQEKVETVITINSPIKQFQQYYNSFFGYCYPKPIIPLMATELMGYAKPDGLHDVIFFDSTDEANWIAQEKQLLTFTSGEHLPADSLFDDDLGDMFPRVIDDGTVPTPAQYTEYSDTVYYGIQQHESVFRDLSVNGARDNIAENISRYLVGEPINCSVLLDSGVISHRAHFFNHDTTWTDCISPDSVNETKDHVMIQIKKGTFPFKSGISDVYWSTDDSMDAELIIQSYAMLPFTDIVFQWQIFEQKTCIKE
ncbi:MAG: alpha/beta hydrolase [Thermoplasmatota archaeon]